MSELLGASISTSVKRVSRAVTGILGASVCEALGTVTDAESMPWLLLLLLLLRVLWCGHRKGDIGGDPEVGEGELGRGRGDRLDVLGDTPLPGPHCATLVNR